MPRASRFCAKPLIRHAKTSPSPPSSERGLPQGHPLRQRRALCQPQRLVQPVKALSLVAPARHRHRAHQARPSATKWRHERTHLTLKKEATRPPGMNSLQQQARFDAFVHEFNAERPHEPLAMKCPAEIYSASTRPYEGLPDIAYPFHDRDILVTACGRICMHSKKINNLDRPRRPKTRNQRSRRRHLARELHALRSRLLRPGAKNLATPRQPVRPEVVTHVLGTFRYLCLRTGHRQRAPSQSA
jgi:hypothetical protein